MDGKETIMDQFAGYIFDLDGTIYLGDNAIKGAAETIHYLQSHHKKMLFLTNKTIESRERYVKKLRGFGIDVGLENLLSPSVVTLQYLHKHYPNALVYLIGEAALKDELQQGGIKFAESPEETDMIVVSWDREFHYKHLDFAYQSIRQGARMIATHPDRTCPVSGGEVPDCGGMIGAIEAVTNRKIDVIMGKPSTLMASTALNILQVEASDCLMVGDRLETDILMGQLAGMRTALVLTGATSAEDVRSALVKPEYILNSVFDLMLHEQVRTE
ncbi:phosphoglycolate/pyridoxal phosphate phosphatase family enzyme/HAD superfamily hydrolase (TIGR01450 family) [Cohnella sp. SGD-V74]|uniref:HAD-IIA family hydrolase n=1 Tax=unclassified Cohnella TaxID=2636738 RepID=UPI000D4C8E33|nr:phosphoglycolate/pyridoxal phosphate phosphatase family enzyme/HAD superfamily hydrolase (TIGR01450 family) [Cohnella sp. SGD-V74]